MRALLRIVVLLVALGVLFVAVIFGASELGGETVTLETSDASGGIVETRLWVVEYDGSSWLRAGVPTSSWLVRIEANDSIAVTRAGEKHRYRAVPVHDPATRDAVHDANHRKYGWAEQVVSLIRDGSKSVPVRLDADTAS